MAISTWVTFEPRGAIDAFNSAFALIRYGFLIVQYTCYVLIAMAAVPMLGLILLDIVLYIVRLVAYVFRYGRYRIKNTAAVVAEDPGSNSNASTGDGKKKHQKVT